jgi:predicted RNA-binding Zn-ribbon protein involved in translation (DUF1610 family)
MIKNIDKSWKCPCPRNILIWNKESQAFECPKCGEQFLKASQMQRKPPGLIQRVINHFSKNQEAAS